MKRNLKRLTLNRETVRHLNAEEMAVLQGGAASDHICPVTQTCYCPVLTNMTCGNSCPTFCPGTYCCASR